MYNNKIAKILHNLGIGILIFAAVGAMLIFIFSEFNWGIALGLGTGCALQGALFIGLSEIIELLQKNVDQQAKMVKQLDILSKRKPSSVEVLSDIESNLPTL